MTLKITIDIFSGRPNPVIELNPAESREIMDRIRTVEMTAAAERAAPVTGLEQLGYRGFLIEQVGEDREAEIPARLRIAGPAAPIEQRRGEAGSDVEELVFGAASSILESKLPEDIADFCHKEFLRARARSAPGLKRMGTTYPYMLPYLDWTCQCAPVYEPEWWNDGGPRQLLNNCYNYSTNYRTNTFAQPGRGAGTLMTSVSCSGVKPLALLDGLNSVFSELNQCPVLGHLVALVIAPGFDFHWYRKDLGGMWSHKIGPQSATEKDNDGNLIYDPRFAARGPYTDFCGFLIVRHGHIKLE